MTQARIKPRLSPEQNIFENLPSKIREGLNRQEIQSVVTVETASCIVTGHGQSPYIILAGISEKHGGKYVIPGGKLDKTDISRAECAARELREETGALVALSDLRKIGVATDPLRHMRLVDKPHNIAELLESAKTTQIISGNAKNPTLPIFVCFGAPDTLYSVEIDPQTVKPSDELKQLEWVDIRTMPMSNFAAGHDVIVAAYRESLIEGLPGLRREYLHDFEDARLYFESQAATEAGRRYGKRPVERKNSWPSPKVRFYTDALNPQDSFQDAVMGSLGSLSPTSCARDRILKEHIEDYLKNNLPLGGIFVEGYHEDDRTQILYTPINLLETVLRIALNQSICLEKTVWEKLVVPETMMENPREDTNPFYLYLAYSKIHTLTTDQEAVVCTYNLAWIAEIALEKGLTKPFAEKLGNRETLLANMKIASDKCDILKSYCNTALLFDVLGKATNHACRRPDNALHM